MYPPPEVYITAILSGDLFSYQNSENRSHDLYQPMIEPEFPAKISFGWKIDQFWWEIRSLDKVAVMYTSVGVYISFDV